MKTLTTIAILLGAVGVGAQSLPTAATSARSVTGQFYVTSTPKSAIAPSPVSAANTNLIRLEPTWVAVSCERIKQALWRELEVQNPSPNRIAVTLFPARTAADQVTIVTERMSDGWNYRVALPDSLPRELYLKAVVQVVLLELANRTATGKPAEIPVWLTEGLSFHLHCNYSPQLLLNAPAYGANGLLFEPSHLEIRRFSTLEKAHKLLVGTRPLTFEELSWPVPGQFEGPDGPRSQASAQLLVCELLKLHGGPECLRNFLAALPDYLNWQMAFLRGFEPHFKRPLDVEKWWALEAMDFAGRDLTQTWPYEESWSNLSSSLLEPVDVFLSTNDLPMRSEVTLQTIVREWDGARRKDALRRRSRELSSLQIRIAPELLALTSGYAAAIEDYLKRLDALNAVPGNPRITAGGSRIAQVSLLKRLDQLEAERERLRPGAGGQPARLATSSSAAGAGREMDLPVSKLRAN